MPGLNYVGVPVIPPAFGEVFDLTNAPDGGWCAPQQSRAVYYNGKTYFGWVNGDPAGDGWIKVAAYNHATQTVEGPTIIDTPGVVDDHNNPALLIRDSDKRLVVAYCLHNGPNMWWAVATNPEDVSSFAASVNLDSSIGASDYTYPILFQLTGVTNDPIYLFYRDFLSSDGRLAYSKSADGGTTWSARTLVHAENPASNLVPYFQINSDGISRIDVVTTDRAYNGSEGTVDLGHMYMDGTDDKWYTSAGVEITATKPFLHSEMTQLETNLANGCYALDIVSGANPIVVYFTEDGSGNVTAKYARWDGATWDKAEIYTEPGISFDSIYGFLAINRADVEEVFSGVNSGVGMSELYTYVSADAGATWDAGTQITFGSADYNAAVTSVYNADPELPIIWLRGIYNDVDDFPWGIKGLRR